MKLFDEFGSGGLAVVIVVSQMVGHGCGFGIKISKETLVGR